MLHDCSANKKGSNADELNFDVVTGSMVCFERREKLRECEAADGFVCLFVSHQLISEFLGSIHYFKRFEK